MCKTLGSNYEKGSDPIKSTEEAHTLLLSHARIVDGIELVGISQALGRVLAEQLISQVAVPPWDNSAMDGYAVNSADLSCANVRMPI
ncbi:MAG: hypothetical protein P8Z39_07085, partial [Gammaproteobacteria bacterium]